MHTSSTPVEIPNTNTDKKTVVFTEDIFRPYGNRHQYFGCRKIVAEVQGSSMMPGFLRLHVISCSGQGNNIPAGAVIHRPVYNVLGGTVADLVINDSFKTGGYVAQVKNGRATPMPDARSGGMSVGNSHANGGIKGSVGPAERPIEFEGREIILTAPVSTDTRKYEFEGKQLTARQIASDLNVRNGGVAFADGGMVRCNGKEYSFGGRMCSDYDIVAELNSCGCSHTDDPLYDTLSKLNAGSITLDQAYNQLSSKGLK